MDARIDLVPPRGRGGCNTWLVGDDDEVIVVDPGTDADEVLAAVREREILAVICTHGHAGHVAAAPAVAAAGEAPVFLHPADTLSWQEAGLDASLAAEMAPGGVFEVSGVTLEVLPTPGHSPGSVSLYCEELGAVLAGDALLADGPGQHDGEYPDFPGQLSAIGAELLSLPEDTRVLPGHGEQITIGLAGRRFDAWAAGA
jgi:glyoxylase-like metal-dependent hydrolase (beta-lactamase superfamily II)